MDRGAWQATVRRVAKSGTEVKQLTPHTHTVRWATSGKDLEAKLGAGRLGSERQVCYWLPCCLRPSPATPETAGE